MQEHQSLPPPDCPANKFRMESMEDPILPYGSKCTDLLETHTYHAGYAAASLCSISKVHDALDLEISVL